MITKEEMVRSIKIGLKYGCIVGFFYLLIYCSFLVPILSYNLAIPPVSIFYFNQNQVIATDNEIDERYINEIVPRAKEEIDREINRINSTENNSEKLDEIFRWETEDWHNPQWETNDFNWYNNSQNYISYRQNPNKLRTILQFENSYFRQQNPQGIYYADDPYWLAFNKVGCCREIANLFSYMAQRSGIESRTVSSIGGQHRWVEVKINGEWMYYDPWCAYDRYKWNETFKEKWFNKIENYRDNCHGFTVLNVYDGIIPNPEPTFTYPLWYGVADIKKILHIKKA
jgi:hypothetical protein